MTQQNHTLDPAAAQYLELRRAVSKFAHGLDDTKGMGERDPALDADDFGTTMLAIPPTDLAGAAVRLGYVLATAWVDRAGDWDCPLREGREAVTPPTDAELCASAEGQNGGLDALFRALATLQQALEAAAGIAQ